MSSFTIRAATPEDVPAILGFIKALAIFEKEPDAVISTENDLHTALFGDQGSTQGIICESDGKPIGFAVYFLSYSTWQGKHGLYLEDLYISEDARGMGAGRALFQYLAQIAIEQGLTRFDWSVLDWNTPAIKFYEAFGAKPQSEWIKYRLTGEALLACANGQSASTPATTSS